MVRHRNTPSWWREADEGRTKKLYQPEPRPVVYIVPVTSILGRLPLIPAGDHGTIPAEMRHRKKELFDYGRCDRAARALAMFSLTFLGVYLVYIMFGQHKVYT